jgi:signal transduction histidine kinase
VAARWQFADNYAVRAVPSMSSLVRQLAREPDPARLSAALHQIACELTGATASVLLRPSPQRRGWMAASAAGLESLPLDGWLVEDREAAAVGRALVADAPLALCNAACTVPHLAGRLADPSSVVIVPLIAAREPLGVLLLAFSTPELVDVAQASTIGDAFVVAIERGALHDALALGDDLRGVLESLARDGSSPVALAPALDACCRGLARVVAADRARLWLHDRRARLLACVAGSDFDAGVRPAPVASADPTSPIAAALRRTGAEIVASVDDAPRAVGALVTLRGRRRALGVLALDGVRVEPGGEVALLERCRDAGQQLSAVLENVQLLDDIIRSRAEWRNVFDALSELVVLIGADELVVDVNHACAARLQQAREALVDRRYEEVLSSAMAGWVGQQRAAGSLPAFGVLEDPALRGWFELTLTATPSADPAAASLVLVARDVTVAARLEHERVELTRRLAQTEKLLALGQFVAGIAHEWNNPLQAVLGHLELITASSALPRGLARDLKLVYREADRAARIVANLLVFAGSGKLRRRTISINRVVSRVLELRTRAPRAARIERVEVLDARAPTLRGDQLLLEQALLNVVINAEQAAGEGGRIEVRTGADGDGGVRVWVTDNGPGLPDAVRGRLFEPFFTTRADHGGTGLGLAIAYGVVQAHGGRIEASSTPGSGAVFSIWLPVAAPGRRRG